MARTYSATLALLAMAVVFVRGIRAGSGFSGTVTTALIWTAAFAVIGALVGLIARQTVDESVRLQIEQELAAGAGPPQARGS